ncbi:flavin-containing monooxygenase [Undibacterium terreum]|uniref:Baeyer-Villiger monooxygenase n=1 Tax=Undibacterium terreum TaxID=1224302 RepID=A0A916UDA1_9BURK|nr:NAD(P)/FAD-dependent oxidoreductase [Undibacterium terreum]GGC68563.1 Baeyer-Villiger monooxygenase [Undibacterium terreum]
MLQQEAEPQAQKRHEVIIIGSGFAGLCMAARLKRAGIDDFLILEKDKEFGGTWRVNHYPGCACDVPSHLYSFSFLQNPEWTRKYAPQNELLDYTCRAAKELGLMPHLQLDTALLSADYDEEAGLWRLHTSRGELSAKNLVAGMGALGRPSIPNLPGLENFQGKIFHSQQWDHSYALKDKRVAVIGTGASAIQFVPEIAPEVAQLDLYQRTPPWVLPRPDRAISNAERWLLRHVKASQWAYRALNYARNEWRYVAFGKPTLMLATQKLALGYLRKQIRDPELRRKLTPDYVMGCKRILLSNDYYPALARPNVTVHTSGIREIRAGSIIDKDGHERPADALIFATGFDLERVLGPLELRGRGGISLQQAYQNGLDAYKGTSLHGFPNFYMITGPNTGLGHNSMIYMIESAVDYVLQAILSMQKQNIKSLEVKEAAAIDYNRHIQQKLKGTVWSSGCKSWYLNSRGKNLTIWPGYTFEYRRLMKKFDVDNYHAQTG